MTISKIEIRQRCHQARSALSDAVSRSALICKTVMELDEFMSATAVGLYFDLPGEVQTTELARSAIQSGKEIYAPSCIGSSLQFYRVLDVGRDLEVGAFGAREVRRELRAKAERECQVSALNVVLVPGVAFDKKGARVGWGKGFYDRFLATLPTSTLKVGICFDVQFVDEEILTDKYDIPMDIIATETRLLRI